MKKYTDRINRRLVAVFAAFCVGMAGLSVRLYSLTTSDGLMQTAQSQRVYTLQVLDERGMIYDCGMQPLVAEGERYLSAVYPTPGNQQAVLDAVPEERREAVAELLETGRPFTLETDRPVEAEMVYCFQAADRYAEAQTAAHLIGYLDYEGNGVTGIEAACDEFLSAHGREVEVSATLNALQQVIPGLEPEVRMSEDAGAGVVLTIDKEIQQCVETIGGEMLEKGAIVVLNPYSGQIKAAASFPAYSPLYLEEAVADAENSPMINRAFLPYSVGSTFKVVTAAAALETLGSEYCLTREYECVGYIDVLDQRFHCHDRAGHGKLDLFGAVKESCNPWFIGLGLETGGEALLRKTVQFGFGEEIRLADGITVQGGSIPAASDLINPAAVANLSFGQGNLSASPVQIARMMAAVVNGGELVAPTLVVGTTLDGESIDVLPRPVGEKVMEESTARQLQLLLSYAVMADDSSGALPETVTAGGKTATAQTGRYDEEGDELEEGWFAGFFPAEDPRYVVVVLAENEGFGNSTAAPVFAAVADGIAALGK